MKNRGYSDANFRRTFFFFKKDNFFNCKFVKFVNFMLIPDGFQKKKHGGTF